MGMQNCFLKLVLFANTAFALFFFCFSNTDANDNKSDISISSSDSEDTRQSSWSKLRHLKTFFLSSIIVYTLVSFSVQVYVILILELSRKVVHTINVFISLVFVVCIILINNIINAYHQHKTSKV